MGRAARARQGHGESYGLQPYPIRPYCKRLYIYCIYGYTDTVGSESTRFNTNTRNTRRAGALKIGSLLSPSVVCVSAHTFARVTRRPRAHARPTAQHARGLRGPLCVGLTGVLSRLRRIRVRDMRPELRSRTRRPLSSPWPCPSWHCHRRP